MPPIDNTADDEDGQDPAMDPSDDVLAAEFERHRSHLFGVAYRLTGSRVDAEDAVQEAWLRLARLPEEDRAGIRDLPAWLVTVVGRLCLDRLRSAVVQRERYVGPWLPEPLVVAERDTTDPLAAVVRDEGVRMAAMVVLERLTPDQRVAFVLHDAFAVPFADLGLLLPDWPGDAGHPAMSHRVTSFAIRDGKVAAFYDVVNPDKLVGLPS